MSSVYQNIYPLDPAKAGLPAEHIAEQLATYAIDVGSGCFFSGQPRVAFTRVAEQGLIQQGLIAAQINAASFAGKIRIGRDCYCESGHLPAFHNLPIKLTSVQINDGDAGRIEIGNRVVLQGVAILAYQSVVIEDEVSFGPMVTIMDSSGHPMLGRGMPGEASQIKAAAVVIRQQAWIGTGATILKGVEIGEGAIVGSQAVVYDDVHAYSIALGNPARVVKRIDPQQVAAYRARIDELAYAA